MGFGCFDVFEGVLHGFWDFTLRVGGLSNCVLYRLISIISPVRIRFGVLRTLLSIYLLSPPTLQVVVE